jgi:hypothetical protein
VLALVGGLGLSGSPAAANSSAPGSPQGNVTPTLEPARGVAAVAQSAPVDGTVAVLLHNGTDAPVRIERITGVATRGDGGLAVRERSRKSYPQVLAPDQLALASVRFRKRSLTPDLTVTVKVHSRKVSTARARRTLSVGDLVLSAPMTGTVAQSMDATVTNDTSSWTAHHPAVAVVCFGEASTPTTFASARASARRIGPGKHVAATVPLPSLCPTYLVAARSS